MYLILPIVFGFCSLIIKYLIVDSGYCKLNVKEEIVALSFAIRAVITFKAVVRHKYISLEVQYSLVSLLQLQQCSHLN